MAYIRKGLFDLAKRYAEGCATREEFDGLSVEDSLKVRAEPEFLRYANVGYANTTLKALAPDAAVKYVMISEHPIGIFKDLPLRDAMNWDKFSERGGPFIYQHGRGEPKPNLGNITKVAKGPAKTGEKAWHGTAEFTEEGAVPFNDMVQAAVRSGAMPAGSMGFRIQGARAPKKSEEKKHDIDQTAIVYDDMEAIEFSAVDVGRDEKATVFYGETEKQQKRRENKLTALVAEWKAAGVYDEEVIKQFMEHVVNCEPDQRFTITMPECSWTQIDDPISEDAEYIENEEGDEVADDQNQDPQELENAEEEANAEVLVEDADESHGSASDTDNDDDSSSLFLRAFAQDPEGTRVALKAIADGGDRSGSVIFNLRDDTVDSLACDTSEALTHLSDRIDDLEKQLAETGDPLAFLLPDGTEDSETTDVESLSDGDDDTDNPDGADDASLYALLEESFEPDELEALVGSAE